MITSHEVQSERPVLWYAFAPPPGVFHENLRKRGVDMVRIGLPGLRKSHRFSINLLLVALIVVGIHFYADKLALGLPVAALCLLASAYFYVRTPPGAWDLAIAPATLTLTGGSSSSMTHVVGFADIESIAVREPNGAHGGAVVMTTSTGQVVFANDHPLETLNWLKNALVMEIAGLTWRPLHGVSRNRSRTKSTNVVNPVLLKPDLAVRLISIYQALAPDVLEQLKVAVEAKDAVGIRQYAHWLKSASANIGARHLSELCQLMQIYGAEKNLSRTDVLLKEIARKNADVLQGLKEIRDTAAISIAEATPPTSPVAPSGQLPDERSSRDTAASADPLPVRRMQARVLVVDDSAVSREIADEFLSGMVETINFAKDGNEALQLWESREFDIILMDCEMEGMDGYECASKLRQKERWRGGMRVPIIALTAHALQGDRARCLAAGMDDYLSKPYTPEDLQEKLEKWLSDDAVGVSGTALAVTAARSEEVIETLEFVEEPTSPRRKRSMLNKPTAPTSKPSILAKLRSRASIAA